MLGVSDCWSGGVHSGKRGWDSSIRCASQRPYIHDQVVEPFFNLFFPSSTRQAYTFNNTPPESPPLPRELETVAAALAEHIWIPPRDDGAVSQPTVRDRGGVWGGGSPDAGRLSGPFKQSLVLLTRAFVVVLGGDRRVRTTWTAARRHTRRGCRGWRAPCLARAMIRHSSTATVSARSRRTLRTPFSRSFCSLSRIGVRWDGCGCAAVPDSSCDH